MTSRIACYSLAISCGAAGAILGPHVGCDRAQPTAPSRPAATQTAATQTAATQPAATRPARKFSNAEVRNGLDHRQLPKVQFQATLSEAIDFMRDVTGLPIDVQWDKLKAAGIDQKTPVTVNLPAAKMRDILTAILTSAAGKPGVVGYAVAGGAVVVGPTHPPTTRPAPTTQPQ